MATKNPMIFKGWLRKDGTYTGPIEFGPGLRAGLVELEELGGPIQVKIDPRSNAKERAPALVVKIEGGKERKALEQRPEKVITDWRGNRYAEVLGLWAKDKRNGLFFSGYMDLRRCFGHLTIDEIVKGPRFMILAETGESGKAPSHIGYIQLDGALPRKGIAVE